MTPTYQIEKTRLTGPFKHEDPRIPLPICILSMPLDEGPGIAVFLEDPLLAEEIAARLRNQTLFLAAVHVL